MIPSCEPIVANLSYFTTPNTYQRRPTREVKVGNIGVGGANPIRIQSMTTANTLDTEKCVTEILALHEAGCEIVRLTAPSIREAANLKNIKAALVSRGIDIPLVADIHFTPNAALEAAKHVEKVRINPGNFSDKKKFNVFEYTDAEYADELLRVRDQFIPLVMACKDRKIAMRIGTNHGSLSDRIMNRYGDTPLGMVESALEFARICRELNYHNLIFSMKASDPKIMIQAYRMLVQKMDAEEMDYPLHLGVTEAGEGIDGRLKSAIGIGSLLADGIGDTIRVSLTEDSVNEIPVARDILQAVGVRRYKTDYVACPSCGRTQFDLQETTARIKAKTSHLKDVKIAIMGCIVNGPGEMADADFGYVGSGPGVVSLYVGKVCIKKNIPAHNADQELVDLIKVHHRWVDPA